MRFRPARVRLRDRLHAQPNTGVSGQPCQLFSAPHGAGQVMVELRGLEPLTPCLQSRCSSS